MGPFDPGAVDPNTGQVIGVNDIHYNIVRLYYNLKPVYDPEFQKLRDYYLNRTWHDYAILLLQTAEALNIKVRPPGFKAAPVSPTAHKLILTTDYQIKVSEIPVVSSPPPDPDPAKQVIKLSSNKTPEGFDIWEIVDGTPSTPTIAAVATISKDQALAFLKSLSRVELTDLLTQIFN